MKFLLAGNYQYPIYEPACADALGQLGFEVERFAWGGYFRGLPGRAQEKYALPGPAARSLNRDLLTAAERVRPDVLFLWRPIHVRQKTLKRIKNETGAHVVTYNNDDPFGWRSLPKTSVNSRWYGHHRWYWRHFMRCVPLADQQFVYRPVNVRELEAAGGRNVSVLMPYFVPSLHRPVELKEDERKKYGCDAVFVGHYEPDGRVSYLAALVNAGLHVKLFGGGYWTRQVLGDLADRLGPATAVVGDEYAKALCGADMCLAFLSRLNRDTYTRRCFEIPACGCLLLCERTDDLRQLFREDEEAVFFSTVEELVEKALWLKGHPDDRARIAAAGMRRVQNDGHDVTGRMRQMLSHIEALKQ